jgi:Tannase and feruloyl esterase
MRGAVWPVRPVMRIAVGILVLALAAVASSSTGPRPTGGPPARGPAGQVAVLAAQTGQVILPKLVCGTLVQAGGLVPTGVPDFTRIPNAPTHVTSASVVPGTATAPEFCDVRGYVAPQVQFELKLPTSTWQGRYLQQGCGGYCGAIPTTGFLACDLQPQGNFAVAATNDGHVGGDGLWALNDEQLRIDYGSRAVHVVSIAAKAILAAYYGVGPQHSYFNGCSDGGREALMEAQRYPADFDGIVAGAPEIYAMPLNAEEQAWNAIANLDANGGPILTADKLPALHAAVLAACDAKDGLADGQIDDPRQCTFDPASIQCAAGQDGPGCLTPAQVAAARKLYQGVEDPQGRHLYPGGLPLGSEGGWVPFAVPPPGGSALDPSLANNYLEFQAFRAGQLGPSVQQWQFTVDNFNRLRPEAQVYDALDADLSAFQRRGGKLIIWHGWSDPGIPPFGTLAYYAAVRDRMGGLAAVQRFARMFMFPSVYHCGGGYGPNQFDVIDPITHWVEQGNAPQVLVASQTSSSGAVVRTRPIFPYPERAQYVGSGSIDDAANFKAVTPSPLPDDHVDWVGNDLFRAPVGPEG